MNSKIDEEWDAFLEQHPAGRREQTSRWGIVKGLSGWETARHVLRDHGGVAGGFQLLWKPKRPFGRIGYVSHGPVWNAGGDDTVRSLIEALQDSARNLKLRALLVQPAADDPRQDAAFRAAGFHPLRWRRLIGTSACLDLTLGEEELLRRMHQTRRRTVRISLRGPLHFREADRTDLPVFFSMMQSSCDRQGVAPSPPTLETVQLIWDLFEPAGWLKLFLVSHEGHDVAGGLVILFGDRCWFWKTGWTGTHRKLAPNDFLYWNITVWAMQNGYAVLDFCGIDPRALDYRRGGLPNHVRTSPSFYKALYNPERVDLPTPLLWFSSLPVRRLYGACLGAFSPPGLLNRAGHQGNKEQEPANHANYTPARLWRE